jgi:surface polysaccharide O-acyltransferase-like enzyme
VLIAPPYVDNLGRQNGRFVLGPFSVPLIVMSVCIFRAAWQRDHEAVRLTKRHTGRLTSRIAPATFGIYLVHVAVLIGLREVLAGHDIDSPFLVNVVPGTAVAFGLSYGITLFLQRIPFLKRLV